MKKTKIKWDNIIKALILVFCIGVVARDLFMLTIYSSITGKLYGWTWFGFITFLTMFPIIGMILEDFDEQNKKMSAKHDSQHLR